MPGRLDSFFPMHLAHSFLTPPCTIPLDAPGRARYPFPRHTGNHRMKTLGLIGGMSWESTAIYYRHLNEMVRERLGGLHSAKLLLWSFDFDEVAQRQHAGDWDGAAALMADAARRLRDGGAQGLVICTNTMHLVADPVARAAGVPLIDIIAETGKALTTAGRRRPLLLATRYTMEHGFYAERMRAASGIEVIVPEAQDRTAVHAVIFEELCRGIVSDASRERLFEIIDRGIAAGADSVILGCTEICLILDPDRLALPGFDSTAIHARAAVEFALRDEGAGLLSAA